MQILSAEQIHQWDQYTIEKEPIASIDLMERAAGRCLEWIESNQWLDKSFCIFCGKGNNGGDGLALARMLAQKDANVVVYILEFGHKGTADFQANLARLHQTSVEIRFIQTTQTLQSLPGSDIYIDALFGSGLNRALEGITADLIIQINNSGIPVVAIDLPSGLYADRSSKGHPVIQAMHTLTFQCYKPAFLVAENAAFFGSVHILNIGLLPEFAEQVHLAQMTDIDFLRAFYKPRGIFSHKGNFGHALLLAGSYGRMGAALMSARACLRSGAGLLTCRVPRSGNTIIQTGLPEAMVDADGNEDWLTGLPTSLEPYNAIAFGPGIGQDPQTATLLPDLLKQRSVALVLDADALNLLSKQPDLIKQLPPYSILTPHPKEFERLFGKAADDFDRITMARDKAKELQCVIILKGHYSLIALPGGAAYYNSTGNAGMAKGGSGDTLTGILLGLLAQGYSAPEAALLGVFVHGLAGDFAAAQYSTAAMLPSDLTDCLSRAFLHIEGRIAGPKLPV